MTSHYVKPLNSEISAALQRHMFSKNMYWNSGETQVKNVRSTYLIFSQGLLLCSEGPENWANKLLVTIEEFVKIIDDYTHTPDHLDINNHRLTFEKEGIVTVEIAEDLSTIEIGYDTIEDIHDRLNHPVDDFESFYVKTHSESVFKVLQNVAFENGFVWFNGDVKYRKRYDRDRYYLIFKTNHRKGYDRYMDVAGIFYEDKNICDLGENAAEAIERLSNVSHLPEDIHLGEYKVEFRKDGIKIGCKTFSREDVQDVIDHIEQIRREN